MFNGFRQLEDDWKIPETTRGVDHLKSIGEVIKIRSQEFKRSKKCIALILKCEYLLNGKKDIWPAIL